MSLARRIFSNTAWQIFGKVVTAILGIVSVKLITNYLSRSDYGEYTTIYDYTAIFAIIADFGLFTIAVREMAHDSKKKMVEKIAGNVLSLRTILAVIFLGLGTVVAFIIPAYKGSHIPYGVSIVAVATVIIMVATTTSSVLQFYLRMAWASAALMIGKLVTVSYIVFTIVYFFPNDTDAGFPHLLLGWILGGLITLIITYIATCRVTMVRFQFDFVFWKEVIMKALPYGLALVLGTVYFRMGTLVLSLYDLKEQAGYYGVPLRFLEILQIIPHYFMNSVLPTLTVRLKENALSAERIVQYSLSALAGLALPIMVGGYLLAWPITIAVSSPEFLSFRTANGELILGSDVGLKLLLIAMLFTYLHVVLSYTLVAMGRQTEILFANAIVVAVNIALNFLLAPKLGFIGASISALCSEITMFGILWYRVRLRMKNIWDNVFLSKTLLSVLVMGSVLFISADFLNRLFFSYSLLILIPLGGILFGLSLILTKAIPKEMFAMFKRRTIDSTQNF